MALPDPSRMLIHQLQEDTFCDPSTIDRLRGRLFDGTLIDGSPADSPAVRMNTRMVHVAPKLRSAFEHLSTYRTKSGRYVVFGVFNDKPFVLEEENTQFFPSDELISKLLVIGA